MLKHEQKSPHMAHKLKKKSRRKCAGIKIDQQEELELKGYFSLNEFVSFGIFGKCLRISAS